MRLRVRGLRRTAIIGAGVAAVAVVVGLGATGTLKGPEQQAIDARFAIRGTERTDQLAVVAIDERTFSSLDITWPMRRRLHAEMVDRLREAGVSRLVYDVQFTEPSDHPSDDNALFDAVAATKGTILATGESDARGRTRVLGGDEQLASIGAQAAGSTFPSDSGGVIRRYSRENANLTSLAAKTAESVGVATPRGEFDGRGEALIDYRGPTGTIPTYSFSDVLSGKIDASLLRGRVVVVGATAPVLQDVHATSAAGPRLMPGPEIQANAIWTALHGNPLRELPAWASLLLAALFGGAGVALALRLAPLRASVAGGFLGAAYLGGSVLAFNQGAVLPVAVPVLSLAAGLLVSSLVAVAGELALRAQLARYNEQLERDVAARTAELTSSQLEVVLRLAQAAELRDDDTGEHIDRMSALCGDVARELGASEEEADLMRHASALHDIGKIGVPDSILLKPGRLTDEEMDVMRTHVVQGAELLVASDAPVLRLAEVVCRTHHEKWDGTGYPNRIAGEDIPMPGRISAACDVFDALTHERPYKRAWSIEEACAELDRGRGAHFDTDVIDALFAVLERQGLRVPPAADAGSPDGDAEARLAA